MTLAAPTPSSFSILLSMLRVAAGRDEGERLRCLLRSAQMEPLRLRAEKEGLSGILVDFLHDSGLPADRAEVDLQVQSKRAYREELFRIHEALQKLDTSLLVLKGAALGASVYRNRPPGWRPWRDVDLLVRRGQLARVEPILLELGFQRASGGFYRDSLNIDLHTDLLGASRIPARSKAFRFDVEQLWSRSLALHAGMPRLRVLSGPDQFAHLAVHAMKHSYSRLVWLFDLCLLYPTLDPNDLWQSAESCGAQKAVAMALHLQQALLGEPFAALHRDKLVPLSGWERLFLRLLQEGRQPEIMGELLCVLHARGFRARFEYLNDLFFPPGETSFLHRLRHLFRLAGQELRRVTGQ